MRPDTRFQSGALLVFAIALAGTARGADSPTDKRYDEILGKAYDYLGTKGQAADGSFSAQAGPAVTAIVAHGLLRTGRSADDPVVAKGLKYVQTFVHPDGGIYTDGSRHKNYETCAVCRPLSPATRMGVTPS